MCNVQAGVGVTGLKSKFLHAFFRVFTEKKRGIDLSTDAFLHLQHDITVLESSWPMMLGQFHAEGLIGRLIALWESVGEVNLARRPSVSAGQ